MAAPPVFAGVAAAASLSEKSASSPASVSTTAALTPKPRSCVVCRRRKVRCDKQSPCSNCRRGNIVCVQTSTDKPPRWARRQELLNGSAGPADASPSQEAKPSVDKFVNRLRNLENLVKELSGQLEQAHAAASSAGGSSNINSPASLTQDRDEYRREISPASNASSLQQQFGRLVVQDAGRSRYVSSGFWSRVNDELEALKLDTRVLAGDESDSSEDETSQKASNKELERSASERNGFLFGHNLNASPSNLYEFHPLPSQIPFMLDVFHENINCLMQIIHTPTLAKMVRQMRESGMKQLTPSNEALMFSIYHATITSMEEEDVMSNFGSSKSDLSLKFRLGLEYALAKADFLNKPDMVLVQAFALFLGLVRRYESPRYVWMMSGLVIRMAQYLGLQRDGSNFENMLPFEVEMRRRLWWLVCVLDARASEDQGTELTIPSGSFDTKIPLNINDVEIDPDSSQIPVEREGVTDMSFARIHFAVCELARKMVSPEVRNGAASFQEQKRLLDEMFHSFEQGYLLYQNHTGSLAYMVGSIIARLVISKMTLIIYLPVLFDSSNEALSDEIRTKALISALEVAEYNHELNAEQAYKKWRWIYQTYTHWYATVYLLLEASRRPWSPIVERAWVALHSKWLMPQQSSLDRSLRIWVPLRRLMNKARKHRNSELSRLRSDPRAAARLEMEDQLLPEPSSSGPFVGSSVDIFRQRWRQLVGLTDTGADLTSHPGVLGGGSSRSEIYHSQARKEPPFAYGLDQPSFNASFEPMLSGSNGQMERHPLVTSASLQQDAIASTSSDTGLPLAQAIDPSYDPLSSITGIWADNLPMDFESAPWLWPDVDSFPEVYSHTADEYAEGNMDLDGDINWYNWVETAKGMQ